MKICLTCKESKPETEFSKNKNTGDRLQSSCKVCQHNAQTEWYKKNPAANRNQCKKYYGGNKNKWRERQYKNTYGMTIEEIEGMFVSQNGKCPICEKEFQTIKTMHIDHDHMTGVTRELLCGKCNTAIGLLEENIKHMENAINYVKKWKELCESVS